MEPTEIEGGANETARLDACARHVTTSCADGRMVWRVWGSGPPLVLLHGASGSWTHWVLNIATLSRRLTVLAADMPGFGDSDTPAPPHTADALARFVSDGLDRLVPPPAPFDLAGFSMGGIIAGLVAARQAPRVRTLVLIGPNGMALTPGPMPGLVRADGGADPIAVREAHRENLRRLMIGNPARADDLAVDVHMENVRRTRFRSGGIPASDALLGALPGITARITAIWGTRDVFAGGDVDARRRVLARFQPGLDFRTIDGAGHWVVYEAADRVNEIMLEMLEG